MLFVRRPCLDPLGERLSRPATRSSRVVMARSVACSGRPPARKRDRGHRAVVLDWLRADPALSLDQVAERLSACVPGQGSPEDRVHQARQWVRQLYRSMADQGLLDAIEFAALVRFARERSHDFELPRELRPKNAYNLLRLLATGSS
jgi:hypothetical protein